MTPPSTLLFDLDGVLVDSRGPIARSLNFALERLGLPARPEVELHRFIGPPLHGVFEMLLAEAGEPPERADAGVAAYRELYGEIATPDTPLHAGVADLLETLNGCGFRLAVATSKPRAFAAPILAARGVLGHFETVEGPDLGARGEPKTATVARALRALGASPANRAIAMIGDRHHDVTAGRAHSLLTIGVGWGIGTEQELRTAGAHHFFPTPDALRAFLT
ncbi:MAG: HAD hydrolase-like protein [Myxococcota bacterium]|nr:HAD hydrolase-like protein [Myxococcota bacterium]